MKQLFNCLVILLILLSAGQAFPDSVAEDVNEGNRLFNKEKLDEAIEHYSQARVESPDSDIVNFNLGTAQYKKGQYQEAINSFTNALQTDDKKLEAKATYNLANSKYKLGSLQSDGDLNSAASLYREALDYYKRSIELNTKDKDARHNHEIVEKQLKILLDRMKNQQQEQNQEQDENQEGEEQKSQSDGSKKGQNRKQGDDKQKAGKDEAGEQQEHGESQTDSGEFSDETEHDREGREETAGMSPEEAHMLLESYGQEEAREQVNTQMRGRYKGVLKDW